MAIDILKDTQIRKAIKKEKDYSLTDGGGLAILITSKGVKRWVFYYIDPVSGKKCSAGFGLYPDITLARARELRAEYKSLISQGISPKEHKKQVREQRQSDHKQTFSKVFNEWLELEKMRVLPKTLQTKANRINNHITPLIGDRAIKSINNHGEIAQILEQIGKETPQTAQILHQLLNNIFHYATTKGYTPFNIISNIQAKAIIINKETEHYGKLTEIEDLRAFVNKIYDYPFFLSTRNILKFALHIPLRVAPLTLLKWEYVDFDKKLLTIPRELQKNKNKSLGAFILPLSDEVINILREQEREFKAYPYVFMNTSYKNPIHKDTPTKTIKEFEFYDRDTGRIITAHSFRGIFKTAVYNYREQHNTSTEAINKALDHLHGDRVELSYSEKATFLNEIVGYSKAEALQIVKYALGAE